jgi:hypothetical protein
MERIKQAMDKVRSHPSTEHAKRGAISQNNKPAASPAPSQATDGLENVNYNQTRVVKLKAEHLEKNRIVAYNKNDAMSMNFDLLRTHVLQKMEENGWRTLAITSPNPGSGKTVVAINLAMSIAQQTNRSAMLVDFDLRRPKIGSYLGLPMEKSMNDLLADTAELAEVLINPDIPRLVVLPTKHPLKNSSETLSSQKVSELIKDLRERYESRIVIFDLPPILITDDAIALLPQVDCVLLVVANAMSTKEEIQESLRLVSTANLLGTVMNKAEIEPRAYYY